MLATGVWLSGVLALEGCPVVGSNRHSSRVAPDSPGRAAQGSVDQERAVLGRRVLQPAGERQRGCLEVIGLADQSGGAGQAPTGPANAELVRVMGVIQEERVYRELRAKPP
jgi:hypothetical protein